MKNAFSFRLIAIKLRDIRIFISRGECARERQRGILLPYMKVLPSGLLGVRWGSFNV